MSYNRDLDNIRDLEYIITMHNTWKGGHPWFIGLQKKLQNFGEYLKRSCNEGKIANAEILGNIWIIPKNANKPTDGRSLKNMGNKKIKPFVKWAGGKGQLVETISSHYPAELGNKIRKYAEPFVGGGAVLFDILENYDLDFVYISDVNAELINAYLCIKEDVDSVIAFLKEYEAIYVRASKDLRHEYYYSQRDLYNKLKRENKANNGNNELAALFIFLNRTCFNGLFRVNRKGDFNVPMGSYKNPTICDEENLKRVSDALQNVIIKCSNYKECSTFVDENTLVYFDPPYRPLNSTSNFTSYTEEEFNDEDQIQLADFIVSLAKRGINVIASNSDPKNSNPDDNFFDNIYKELTIERIYASRMINSNGAARGKITELLIYNCTEEKSND